MVTHRFIRTTHYQVGHPIYFGFLIHFCTSPAESKLEQKVVQDIYKILNEHGYNCSREAAKFLVRMAKQMGFLQQNNIWTWKGFVINFFEKKNNIAKYHAQTQILSLDKKVIYLKYFLESDGAFLIHFARKVLEKEGLSKYELRYVDGIVESIYKDVIAEYLTLETDFKKKIELGNFMKFFEEKGYKSKVRIHKAFPHLDPLVDLDILRYDPEKRRYLPNITDGRNITQLFLDNFPSVKTLEEVFSGEKLAEKSQMEYYERAARIYGINYRKFVSKDENKTIKDILTAYSEVKDPVTGLASIRSLKDIVCTIQLVRNGVLYEWPDIDALLISLKKKMGSNLRFHVDRKGEVEYVVVSSR